MATESYPIKEAAEEYVARGYRIITLHRAPTGMCSCPKGRECPSAGKHPVRNGWQKANQMGAGGIRGAFGNDNPYNLGIVTGPESGIFVVDIDPKDGGDETMAAHVAEHGKLPETLTAKTGSAGWHFFFEYPDFEIGNSASTKLGKGIDTRGKGGFVVGAPSVSAKGPYKIVKDVPVAKAPDWLLERLRPQERASAPEVPKQAIASEAQGRVDLVPAERTRIDGYVEGAVAHEIDRLKRLHWAGDPSQYRGEPWDHTVFEVAANLIQLTNAEWANLSLRHVYDAFCLAAPRDPGFDDARVDAKWESALKKVGDNEAAYPPKPSDASWWIEEESAPADIAPAPIVTEDQSTADTPLDPFDAAVASTAGDALPPPPPRVEYMTFNGIPIEDCTLQPNLVTVAKAAALGVHYRAGAHIETVAMLDGLDNAVMAIEDIIAQPQAGPGLLDLQPVEAWMQRSLRSGTPALLWTALREIVAGVDTDAPTLVFKGGSPLLALLARSMAPAVGDQGETMLFGPRVATKEVDGPQIVFEFDDDERIDLAPYLYAIIMRAKEAPGELRIPDEETHDELEKLPDYRAAQLHRARLGLGSRTRVNGDSDAKA